MGLLGLTDSQNYSDIADAIRAKTGTTSTYAPDEMALAIRSISGGGAVILQDKTATPSTAIQTVQYDTGYDGLRKVTIGAIPSDYIIPSGTKQITSNGIIDVAAYKSANVQVSGGGTATVTQLNVTPTESKQTFTALLSGVDGFTPVVVAAVSSSYVGSGVPRRDYGTITPMAVDQAIHSGYLEYDATVAGDRNLAPENIKKDTSIFGITGTYEGSGGATNVVTGAFTTNSTAGVQSISLPYTGTGHIIAAHVFVEGGAYNSGNSWYNSMNRYTVAQWMMSKAVTTLSPTFTTSGSANYGCTAWVFKNSTSAPTSYSRSSAMTTNTFSSSTATSAGATCVRFSSNKNMRCYVSATSTYGLLANTTYHYIVTYSS